MSIYIIDADLNKTFSDIDSFDLKQDLNEQDFVNVSGIIYALNDAGTVNNLYREGADLGAAQANAPAVLTDGQWFYDSTLDKLTLATTTDPSDLRLEYSPQDWQDAKDEARERASEEVESYLDVKFSRPLPKTQHTHSAREYDFMLIKITSILAVIDLISGSDPKDPMIDTFRSQLWNEEGTGYLDRVNKGEIVFSWEVTDSDREGSFEEVTLDLTTTGAPVDPIGITTVEYGVALITIGTGGTITQGTDNTTVTYAVTDGEGTEIVSDTVITTLYQEMGFGINARFTTGIYVAGDTWRMEVKGIPATTGFKSIGFRR